VTTRIVHSHEWVRALPFVIIEEAHALPAPLALEITDSRYRTGLKTVLLTGVRMQDLGEAIGIAVLRRLTEDSKLVELLEPARDVVRPITTATGSKK
jgi:hypothetical protein